MPVDWCALTARHFKPPIRELNEQKMKNKIKRNEKIPFDDVSLMEKMSIQNEQYQ